MFGRKRGKIDNAATISVPVERNTTINNIPTSPILIPIAVLSGIVVLLFLWGALVFILGRLGYNHPDKAAAEFVAILVMTAIAFLCVLAVFNLIINKVFDHLQVMKQLDVDMIDRQARIATLPATTAVSMTNEAKLKARLIRAVVYKALFGGYTDKDGSLFGKVQPWSRRSVLQMIIAGETPTEAVAGSVARWLTEKKFLVSDRQLNLKKYGFNQEDFLQAVTEEIYRDFGRPINFNVNDDAVNNQGYVHIENAK